MSLRALPAAWRPHAERNLPRYTSYPTAVAFEAADGEGEARAWLAATRADQAISAYVHVPFCKRLCWYCGCHTSVFHDYDRVRAFFQTLMLEVDLWADGIGPHAGAAHLHFGRGRPNALSPDAFPPPVGAKRGPPRAAMNASFGWTTTPGTNGIAATTSATTSPTATMARLWTPSRSARPTPSSALTSARRTTTVGEPRSGMRTSDETIEPATHTAAWR